jgi:hypothetical protein
MPIVERTWYLGLLCRPGLESTGDDLELDLQRVSPWAPAWHWSSLLSLKVQTYSLSMSGFWGHGSPLAASAGIDLDPGYIWASLELRIIGTGLVLMTTGIGQVP